MKTLKIGKEKQKEMINDLKCFRQDILWFDAKKHDLFKDYPYEWVAILNKTVVDHQKGDLKVFCDRLRKEGKYDPGHCVVEYVTDKPDPIFCF